jgi:PAS domain S-box-containing protein
MLVADPDNGGGCVEPEIRSDSQTSPGRGAGINLTEDRPRKAALQQRFDALAAAIELFAMPAGLYDSDGVRLAANEAAAAAGGYSPAPPGRRFGDLVPPAAREAARANFARCVATAEPTGFEVPVVRASGDEIPVRLRLLPLVDDSRVVGVLAVAYEAAADGHLLPDLRRAPSLTQRQQQILVLLASAHSTGEIAERLGLATETVRNHVRNILRELSAHSRLEAVVTAERLGLLASTPFRIP